MTQIRQPGERTRTFLRLALAAGAVAGGLALAVATGRAAIGFMPSLNLPDPVIAGAPVEIGPAPPRRARRVLFVIVDGLRYDASRSMASLTALRTRGVDAQATSHYPTLSRPNYVAIATGVPPRWSGVRTNDVEHWIALDSMMARARAAGMRVTFVSQATIGPLGMFADHIDEPVRALRLREELEPAVRAALARSDELVMVLVDEVDDAGHEHGAAAPEYAAAVARADALIGRLLEGFDFEQDAVIVTSDHGHVDPGGHGGVESEVLQVPLVMAGAGVRPGAPLMAPELIDLAPTVCALLGIPAPLHAFGGVLVDALELSPDERDAARRADIDRTRALGRVTAAVVAAGEEEAWQTRVSRGAAVLFSVAGLVILVAWLARKRLLLIDPRVLLVGVPAFPLTFYGMMLFLEQFLSPSMVPAARPLALKLFAYGAIAALVNLLASWFVVAWRAVPTARIAAAAGLSMVGLIVALVPAGVAWVIAGPPFRANLPGPDVLLLPPVTYAAVACFAVSAALLVVAEKVALVVRARRARARGAETDAGAAPTADPA